MSELERLARHRLGREVFAYLRDAAGEGIAADRNEQAFRERSLVPRVLRDVSRVDPGTRLLGQLVSAPVGVAPLPRLGQVHPQGERGVALAAADAGVVFCAATNASVSLEELASAGGTRWFQLYVHSDAAITADLIARAAAAGYGAIVITADRPVQGIKASESTKAARVGDYPNLVRYGDDEIIARRYQPAFTWRNLAALRESCNLPFVLKGVLNAEDARLAVEHGCDGVWVSNHGGRQLDQTVAGVEVVEDVARAVGGEVEVYLDGGVRRGLDALIALALGADAVFIGRPMAYALATSGPSGVRDSLLAFIEELRQAMALAGARDLDHIGRALVR